MGMNDRPQFVKEVHLLYLDSLRHDGVTNMFLAAPYLMREFGLDEAKSKKILFYWMETFGEEDR